MTTQTYNTVIAHTTDAEFRTWGLALHNALVAAGLTNAADTGQIDFSTVARPAVNTAGGYKIYYLDDSLHATAPVYIKLEFGTGTGAAIPQAWITVGIGTNGAGTLSPTQLSTRTTIFRSNAPTSAVINYPTYICVAEGYAGLGFKRGAATSQGYGGFHVCRSCDEDGAVTTEGVIIYTCTVNSSTMTTQSLRFSPVVTRTAGNTAFCLIADRQSGDTTTAVGLNVQTYKHYASWPRMRCNPFLLAAYISDVPLDTEFSIVPVGVTSRTYKQIGEAFGYADGGTNSLIQGCVLWE